MTSGSSKRIRKAVDILLQVSPPIWIDNPITGRRETHTLSFITLTIPPHSSKPTPQWANPTLLAPFILAMKRKHSLSTYIWKAEFQKNGMLHYHITTRSWIHYYSIRDEWNYLLRKNGLLNEHYAKHNNKEPPSTQIKKVYKSKKLQLYLQKEISKTQQNISTKGKLWDCSKNLKACKYYTTIAPWDLNYKNQLIKTTNTEHCTIISLSNPKATLPPKELKEYDQYLKNIPNTNFQNHGNDKRDNRKKTQRMATQNVKK